MSTKTMTKRQGTAALGHVFADSLRIGPFKTTTAVKMGSTLQDRYGVRIKDGKAVGADSGQVDTEGIVRDLIAAANRVASRSAI
jgi:hypothetical protein